MSSSSAIRYAAYTESSTFLLDEEGYCLNVVFTPSASLDTREKAQRCIGAQYVASLDFRIEGGLAALPKVGLPLLFAYTTESGKIALARTGPLVAFETRAERDSGVRTLPDIDVAVDDDDGYDEYDDEQTSRYVEEEEPTTQYHSEPGARLRRGPMRAAPQQVPQPLHRPTPVKRIPIIPASTPSSTAATIKNPRPDPRRRGLLPPAQQIMGRMRSAR